MKILCINGPNLHLLGSRETDIYGHSSLTEIEKLMRNRAAELGAELDFLQSNHEGEIVDKIGQCLGSSIDAIVINPGSLHAYKRCHPRRHRGGKDPHGGGSPVEYPCARAI